MAEHNELLNQSAGHEANVRQWEQSEAGQKFLDGESDRQKEAEAEAKAQEPVEIEDYDIGTFHEHDSNTDSVAVQGQDISQQDDGGGENPPNKSDNKDAWVDYAVSKGADRDEADAATKDDLIDAYGG